MKKDYSIAYMICRRSIKPMASMSLKINSILIFSALFFLMQSSCSGPAQKDPEPSIMVSILPQKYLVERITGENYRVNVLVPPGASAETYEPTPRQMQDVANSAIYFRIGYMEFENTVIRNLQRQNSSLKFVNTAEGVDLIASEIIDHGDHVHLSGVDPHIWLSIPAVKIQLDNIVNAIIEVDPENSRVYQDNYNIFVEELDELHAGFTEKLSDIKRRTFLIFHPALGYFARDYDLNQVSIEQEGKNPTAANMRKIVDIAREEGIRDVFIQMEFERDNATAITRELGGNVVEIDPLSENWMGNMKLIAEKLHEVLNKNQVP